MTEPKKTTRLILVGALLALLAAAGVAVTMVGPDRPISYTGSPPNPSPTAGAMRAVAAAERGPAPDLRFKGPDGRAMTTADLKGKVVLVNLWATWCPPCVAEMPSLDALQRRLGGERFQVVAVSLDRGGAPIAQHWLDRAGLAALVVHTGDTADYQGALLPTSYLIDARGRLAWEGSGAKDWDGPDAVAMVEGVMVETDPTSRH